MPSPTLFEFERAQVRDALCQFLEAWWDDLGSRVSDTVSEIVLPNVSGDELLTRSELGQRLWHIASAAEGTLKPSEREHRAVYDDIQHVINLLYQTPGAPPAFSPPASQTPEEFWETTVGLLFLKALDWSGEEEIISPLRAAELSGRSTHDLSQLADRGRLTRLRDPREPNPRRRTRYLEREVRALGHTSSKANDMPNQLKHPARSDRNKAK